MKLAFVRFPFAVDVVDKCQGSFCCSRLDFSAQSQHLRGVCECLGEVAGRRRESRRQSTAQHL